MLLFMISLINSPALKKIIFIWLSLLMHLMPLDAQIDDFKVSGFLSLGGDAYSVKGISNRRSPFAYHANGGATFTYKNFSVPVNLAYSNQQFSYGYALNRIGLTPTYKWAKGHLGWSSMEFSPYVMNRKQFLGAGLELNPGLVRFSAFAGTLENPKAIQDTILYGAVLLPSFRRKAYGVKIGVGNNKNYFDLMAFNARDDISGLSNDEVVSMGVLPEDNLVIGTGLKLSIKQFFTLESNAAISGLTRNKTTQPIPFDQQNIVDPFFTATGNTQASVAGNIRSRFIVKGQSFGLEYKRIEPNFRSMGLPFIQTDIQAYLAFVNLNFLKSKLSINLQGGLQSNNLRNTKAIQSNRNIANINVMYRPNKQWQFMVQHNNFTNDTEGGTIELSDTLRFTLTSGQSGFFVKYATAAKEDKWHASVNINRQSIQDLSPIARITGDIKSLSASASLGKDIDDLDLNLKGTLLYAVYDGSFDNQQRYGGGISVNKKFFDKKLSSRLDARYFRNDIGAFSNGGVLTSGLNLSYSINKSQSLAFNTYYINKKSLASRDFTELRSGLSYQIRL